MTDSSEKTGDPDREPTLTEINAKLTEIIALLKATLATSSARPDHIVQAGTDTTRQGVVEVSKKQLEALDIKAPQTIKAKETTFRVKIRNPNPVGVVAKLGISALNADRTNSFLALKFRDEERIILKADETKELDIEISVPDNLGLLRPENIEAHTVQIDIALVPPEDSKYRVTKCHHEPNMDYISEVNHSREVDAPFDGEKISMEIPLDFDSLRFPASENKGVTEKDGQSILLIEHPVDAAQGSVAIDQSHALVGYTEKNVPVSVKVDFKLNPRFDFEAFNRSLVRTISSLQGLPPIRGFDFFAATAHLNKALDNVTGIEEICNAVSYAVLWPIGATLMDDFSHRAMRVGVRQAPDLRGYQGVYQTIKAKLQILSIVMGSSTEIETLMPPLNEVFNDQSEQVVDNGAGHVRVTREDPGDRDTRVLWCPEIGILKKGTGKIIKKAGVITW